MAPISSSFSLISITKCETCLDGSTSAPVPCRKLLFGAECGVHLKHSKNLKTYRAVDFWTLNECLGGLFVNWGLQFLLWLIKVTVAQEGRGAKTIFWRGSMLAVVLQLMLSKMVEWLDQLNIKLSSDYFCYISACLGSLLWYSQNWGSLSEETILCMCYRIIDVIHLLAQLSMKLVQWSELGN